LEGIRLGRSVIITATQKKYGFDRVRYLCPVRKDVWKWHAIRESEDTGGIVSLRMGGIKRDDK
jgi:hypothetical protein